MHRLGMIVLLGALTLSSYSWGAEQKQSGKSELQKNPVVVMETNQGIMEIELLFNAAPNTAKNFLDLVKKKFYDGLTFHRIVAGFVIQGGDPQGDGMGGPGYSIKDEKSVQPQVRGTLGMAKSGPNTAGSQFYINLKDNSFLDKQDFCGFAKVVKGMEVADQIAKLPVGQNDKPKEKVLIIKAYVKNSPPEVKTGQK